MCPGREGGQGSGSPSSPKSQLGGGCAEARGHSREGASHGGLGGARPGSVLAPQPFPGRDPPSQPSPRGKGAWRPPSDSWVPGERGGGGCLIPRPPLSPRGHQEGPRVPPAPPSPPCPPGGLRTPQDRTALAGGGGRQVQLGLQSVPASPPPSRPDPLGKWGAVPHRPVCLPGPLGVP